MKKIVIFSGAGMSKESGIDTFRDSGGMWENFKIEEVASPDGWANDRAKVLEFYNLRRRELGTVEPNKAHELIAELEEDFQVQIITQNIDNLHERAGSTNVLHLHGELTKAESTLDSSIVTDVGYGDINIGDKCEKGSQLRPHVVWFGEGVPNLMPAMEHVKEADIVITIGTSLQVYPAAGLIQFAKYNAKKYYIDPSPAKTDIYKLIEIKKGAIDGMEEMKELLTEEK